MRALAPTGWPQFVRPPDAPDWERTAINWLFDVSPPQYRDHVALRRHVVVLARFVVLNVEAQLAAVRRGLSEARGDLGQVADRSAVEAAVTTFQAEEARLLRLQREVGLVEEALRGRRFRPRM